MRLYELFNTYDPHDLESRIVVAAVTGREARRYGWNMVSEDYCEVAVRWIRDDADILPYVNVDKWAKGESHIVGSGPACRACGFMGGGLLRGLCGYCGGDPGEAYRDLYQNRKL